ncbi:hypothetical protein [Pseudonocardia sp.]|uniref:hypothetical protein n=1 Tax=Pseudonocardia sp. TaxID=60912 RepID=UPI003D150268
MTVRGSLRRTRSVLSAEVAAIRGRDPDLDAGDITRFSLPLLLRAVGVLAVGVVPLLVVRGSADTDALLVPLIGSVALTAICTAAVAWLMAITISAVVVMVVYRTPPTASSRLVTRILSDSFGRINDQTSTIALVALIAGLVSLAVGLPTRQGDELAHSVVDDLFAAQVGVLLVGLAIAFVVESIRSAADVVDDQSLLLAWPWALVIACLSWILATTVGPFETTRMLAILLNEWLPASVDGRPRAEVIRDLVPPNARWWAALGPLPVIAAIWALAMWRGGGLAHMRAFVAEDAEDTVNTTAATPSP